MLRTINKKRLLQPLTQYALKRNLATVTNTTNLDDAYDIVIIGGGVAGVSLACSLGKTVILLL
jgi:ubiquinone biosynthesis monooxygenase Coq6